jgi:hypothetical protein
MWHHVVGWTFLDVLKDHIFFETLRTTHPATQLITLAKFNIQQHCCENLKSGTEHIILETFISLDKKLGSDLLVLVQWKELFLVTGQTSSGDLRTETVYFLNC